MKFRRHGQDGSLGRKWFGWIGTARSWFRELDAKKRRLLVGVGTLVVAFVAGYGVAAFVLFPAPIFARAQAVPRVLGLELEQAGQILIDAGFTLNDTVWVSHPNQPASTVVWQEPPPTVAVPPGTGVTLSASRGPQRVPIPDVTGYEQEVARRLIEAAGLTVASVDTMTAPQQRGVVVTTNPRAGQSRPPGSGVRLYVSVGAATISVPDLSGLTLDEAREVLEQEGLALGSTQSRTSSASEPGLIIEQNPAAGTLSAPGAAVAVIIVRGGGP